MADNELPTADGMERYAAGAPTASSPDEPVEAGSTRDPHAPTAGFAGAAAEAAVPSAPPGYELLDEIGSGGMGVVYRARDISLNRHVALKILHTRYAIDGVAARRFNDEAAITGQLQHPGIPPIHQIGTLPDGRPFLAMKLIKGSTLEDLLKERTAPAEDRGRFLAVFEQVCQAVGYAHAHNVIHRDLKPANVMVGSFAEVQVMDWGLAKTLLADRDVDVDATEADETLGTEILSLRNIDSATQAGSILGTPAFMPPEQAGGEIAKIDTRSDVFGLGAILCVMLTGKPPYAAKDSESARLMAIRGHLSDALARLDASGAEPELVALCKQCLSLEPADRPAHGGEVAAAIAAFRQDAEERARQAELERARAEVAAAEQRKRRRVQAALGLAFTALVVLGGAFGWWMQEQRQAREAEERDRMAAVERDVNRAIENAVARYAQARGADKDLALWAEARAAALQARERATEAGAPAEVQERVSALIGEIEQVEKNRRLVATLLEIQASMGDKLLATGAQDFPGADAGYEQAFRDYGTDLFQITPEQGAQLLRSLGRNRTVELAAALDDWAYVRIFSPSGMEGMAHILRVTRDLDPDPLRNRIRGTIIARDWDGLKAIGDELDPAQQPGQTVNLIAVFVNHFQGARGYASTVEYLKRAQPHHPGDFQINHNITWTLNKMGRYEESIPYSLAAIAIRPKSAAAWADRAWALNGLRQHAEAAEVYRRISALSPGSAFAYTNRGRALMALGDRPGAIAAWRDAIPIWKQALEDRPRDVDRPSYRNGLRSAYILLGNVLRDDSDFTGAIAQFREAIALDPLNPSLYPLLEAALKASGDTNGAAAVAAELQNLRIAATLGPLCNQAVALLRSGKTESALALLPKIAEVRKLHKTPTVELGTSLALLGRELVGNEKMAEAEPILRDCLAVREQVVPTSWVTPWTASWLGESLAGQKKYQEAEEHLRRAYDGLAKTLIHPGMRGPAYDRRRTMAELLASLLDATDRPDEARKWRAEAAKYPHIAPPPREVSHP